MSLSVLAFTLDVVDKALFVFLCSFFYCNLIDSLRLRFYPKFLEILVTPNAQKYAVYPLILFFCLNRIPTAFVAERLTGNPDEFNYIINAFNVKNFNFNWDTFDHGTSGTLNAVILGWPAIFGLDISLFTTRATNAALIFVSLLSIFKCCSIASSKQTANLFFAVSVLFFSTSHFQKFGLSTIDIHYHVAYVSESLPVTLLCIGCLALFYFSNSFRTLEFLRWNHIVALMASMAALGAAPFAKLQAAPLAVVLALLLMWAVWKFDRTKLVFLIIGGFIPALMILVPLSMRGNFQDFYIPYILNNFYRGDLYPWGSIIDTLIHVTKLTITQYSILIIVVSAFWLYSKRNQIDRQIFDQSTSFALLITTLATITNILPRMNSDHYNHFTVIFIPLATSALFYKACGSIAQPDYVFSKLNFFGVVKIEQRVVQFSTTRALVFLSFLFPLFHHDDMQYELMHKNRKYMSTAFQNSSTLIQNPKMFNWDDSIFPTDSIYVWGWEPKYYVWSNLMPASKRPWFEHETLDQFWMLRDEEKAKNHRSINGLTPFFKSDLMSDLSKNLPKIILDANTQNGIGFDHLNFKSISFFPELESFITSNYIKYTDTDLQPYPQCPIVYLEKKYAKELSKREVIFDIQSVSGIPNFNIDYIKDNSFGFQCEDYMTVPAETNAAVKLKTHSSPISQISVMAKPNMPPGDLLEVRMFKDNALVAFSEKPLRPWPRWTYFVTDVPLPVDEVSIRFKNSKAYKRGLSEVKIFQPSP